MALTEPNVQYGCYNTSHKTRKCICTYVQNCLQPFGYKCIWKIHRCVWLIMLENVLLSFKRGWQYCLYVLLILSCSQRLEESLLYFSWHFSTTFMRANCPWSAVFRGISVVLWQWPVVLCKWRWFREGFSAKMVGTGHRLPLLVSSLIVVAKIVFQMPTSQCIGLLTRILW